MTFSLSHRKPIDVGHVGIDQNDLPSIDAGPIDLRGWFPDDRRDRPLELEIGCGKGTFLVQEATERPEVNFIGLEYANAYWRYAADRCRRRDLQNVRIVHAEAASFVQYRVPDQTFRQIHIYFPDPWPKKRHHKRRLIQTEFLRQLHHALEPAGLVRITTDHDDYFQWMLEQVAEVADLFAPQPFEPPQSADRGELVGSNFERKYRREGRLLHAMILRKL